MHALNALRRRPSARLSSAANSFNAVSRSGAWRFAMASSNNGRSADAAVESAFLSGATQRGCGAASLVEARIRHALRRHAASELSARTDTNSTTLVSASHGFTAASSSVSEAGETLPCFSSAEKWAVTAAIQSRCFAATAAAVCAKAESRDSSSGRTSVTVSGERGNWSSIPSVRRCSAGLCELRKASTRGAAWPAWTSANIV